MKPTLFWKQLCLTVIFIAFLLYLSFLRLKSGYSVLKDTNNHGASDLPVIIWWTPFTGLYRNVKKCDHGSCIFTEDRKYVSWENSTKAILFYGSDFKIEDLPLPRKYWQWWGLLHEESPKNQPIFDHECTLSLFNLTSTFKFSSGMPLTLQYLQSIESLVSTEYFVSTGEKNSLLLEGKYSPILYLQSDCNPPSKRDSYVKELLKFISIDSYGSCLNNRELPAHLHGIENMNHPDILRLIAKYKFTISFENSACEDYITEKLWRPLEVGSVPIYWGSPSVKKWLPNNQSIIHVRDFETPQELVFHVLNVLGNDTLYENYLEHKVLKSVRNKDLVYAVDQRLWGIGEDQTTKGSFVDAFECYVCDHVLQYHRNAELGRFIANRNHYGCPVPQTMLSNSEDHYNFWVEQWYKSEAEAEVLSHLVLTDSDNFTMDLFYEKVVSLLKMKGHFQRFYQEEL